MSNGGGGDGAHRDASRQGADSVSWHLVLVSVSLMISEMPAQILWPFFPMCFPTCCLSLILKVCSCLYILDTNL